MGQRSKGLSVVATGVTAALSPGPPRARVVRAAAGTLAIVDLVQLAIALADPELLALSPAWTLAIGGAHTAMQTVVVLLPWRRWVGTPTGRWVLRANVAVSAAGLMWAVLIADRHLPGNPTTIGILMLFVLLLGYSALVLDARDHLVLSVAILVAAATAWQLSGRVDLQSLVTRMVLLVGAATLAGVGNRIILSAWDADRRALAIADQHASMLTTVGQAARRLHQEDPGRVVQTVTEAIQELGWQMSVVTLVDENGIVEYADAVGPDRPFVGRRVDEVAPFTARVLETRKPVYVSDYVNHPQADPEAVDVGVRSLVVLPLTVDGRIRGALAAAATAPQDLTDPTVTEPLLLLTSITERAIEMSRRFAAGAETIQELRALDQHKDTFVATVTHELRTPVAVLSGLTQTLDDRWDEIDDRTRRQLIGRLAANVTELEDIVTVLLDVARLHGSDLAAEFRTFDVGAQVHALTDRLGELFTTRPLHVAAPLEPIMAYGDPRLVDRVVENLLTNALRHTPEGTRVAVSVSRDGDTATVRVSDDGPGLPAGMEERLGERLMNPSSPGLGLGLALCREILRLHGSTLVVDSTPDRGATFAFALPCHTGVESTASVPPEAR